MEKRIMELPADHPVFGLAQKGLDAELAEQLKAGISPYAYQKEGLSLFAIALRSKNLPCVNVLINAGRDPNDPMNRFGETPLFFAMKLKNIELFDFLYGAGADPFKANEFGWQPLHIGAGGGLDTFVERLLTLRADVNARVTQNDATALIEAARNGHPSTIKLLVSKGAWLEAQTKDKETALLFAAKAGKPTAVETLLKLGANANHRDSYRKTPLDWAIANKREQCVELLRRAENC